MVVYSTGIYLLAWQGLLVHASVQELFIKRYIAFATFYNLIYFLECLKLILI
jgi:hypothetical protein